MATVAPLDAAAVTAALAPFGSSTMLPAAAYTDDAVLDWERRHFFDAGWVCAGRAEHLTTPGSQSAVTVGTTGVLLVRADDGVLRAFANICRHRGHELLACGATATRRLILCPYHSWTFELDGGLHTAPQFNPANFDPAAMALVELGCRTWGGWVFVNVSGDAAPLEDHLGDLVDLVAGWAPETLVVGATHTYELAGNWKLVQENYHECYHCPTIHPELCRVTLHDSGDNIIGQRGRFLGGRMALRDGADTMSLDGSSGGTAIPTLDHEQRRTVVYLGLFPNLLVSLHPDYVMTHRIEPLDAGRSRVECQWLFTAESVAADGFDPSFATDFWDLTNRQDWSAVESVQRGLRSPRYVPGLLATQEDAVYHFVTMVANGYMGREPEPNRMPEGFTRH